jgi:hypothetical protein
MMKWSIRRNIIVYLTYPHVCMCVHIYINIWKVNVKFAMQHAMKAHRGSRGTALPILNLSYRYEWLVNTTPWPLYTSEKAPVPIIEEYVCAPGLVWMSMKKKISSCPTGVSTPDHPTHSKLLHQLCYL